MSDVKDWEIEAYHNEFEPAEQWELKRKFMEAHKDDLPEEKVVCLAQVLVNIEFLGCKYPDETMRTIAELSRGVVEDFRQRQKTMLQRTFVGASDAASAKFKGTFPPRIEKDKIKGSEGSGPVGKKEKWSATGDIKMENMQHQSLTTDHHKSTNSSVPRLEETPKPSFGVPSTFPLDIEKEKAKASEGKKRKKKKSGTAQQKKKQLEAVQPLVFASERSEGFSLLKLVETPQPSFDVRSLQQSSRGRGGGSHRGRDSVFSGLFAKLGRAKQMNDAAMQKLEVRNGKNLSGEKQKKEAKRGNSTVLPATDCAINFTDDCTWYNNFETSSDSVEDEGIQSVPPTTGADFDFSEDLLSCNNFESESGVPVEGGHSETPSDEPMEGIQSAPPPVGVGFDFSEDCSSYNNFERESDTPAKSVGAQLSLPLVSGEFGFPDDRATSNSFETEVRLPEERPVPSLEVDFSEDVISYDNFGACPNVSENLRSERQEKGQETGSAVSPVTPAEPVVTVLPYNLPDLVLVYRQSTCLDSYSAMISTLQWSVQVNGMHLDITYQKAGYRNVNECVLSIQNVPIASCSSEVNDRKDSKRRVVEAAFRSLAVTQLHAVIINIFEDNPEITTRDLELPGEKSIDKSNVGFKLLKSMGWSGGGLGSNEQGITEPIQETTVVGRQGFGSLTIDKKPEFLKKIRALLDEFSFSGRRGGLKFSNEFTSEERAVIHKLASSLHLPTKSFGSKSNRFLQVYPRQPRTSNLVEIVRSLSDQDRKERISYLGDDIMVISPWL